MNFEVEILTRSRSFFFVGNLSRSPNLFVKKSKIPGIMEKVEVLPPPELSLFIYRAFFEIFFGLILFRY